MKLLTTILLLTTLTFILWADCINNTIAMLAEEQFGIIAEDTDVNIDWAWWYMYLDNCQIKNWDMESFNYIGTNWTDEVIKYLKEKNSCWK